MNSTVVSAATTSTTNMTGFLIMSRGSSLAKAEPSAGQMILGSANVATPEPLRSGSDLHGGAPRSV